MLENVAGLEDRHSEHVQNALELFHKAGYVDFSAWRANESELFCFICCAAFAGDAEAHCRHAGSHDPTEEEATVHPGSPQGQSEVGLSCGLVPGRASPGQAMTGSVVSSKTIQLPARW